MANGLTSPSRVGLVEGNSDNNELFLKKFSGEILQTFEESNVFKALHTIRTIESGKSAQFPVTGIASAAYHTPGENIADGGNSYLSDIKKTEKIINIDKMLIASTFLANIDDVKNHYDIRSVYANELGKALAVRFDTAIAKVFIAASRDSANLTQVGKTGGRYNVADGEFGTSNIVAGTPESVTGAELVSAFLSASAVNKDVGGAGSLAAGVVPQIAGISIYKSNHIPSTDLSAVSYGDGSSVNDVFGANGVGYNGDFRNSLGIVSHSAAVGTVKLLDLATESEYQIERQGTLFVAKYAMGHGVLRPECAIELQK